MPRAFSGAYSPDGRRIAYDEITTAFIPAWYEASMWRHYRGGRTHPVQVMNLTDNSVEKLPWNNSNDTLPMWIGNTIYFLSDRNYTTNVFAYRADTKQVSQLTHHDDFDVMTASAGPDAVVYEQAGYIYLLDAKSGKSQKVNIEVNGDLPWARPQFKKVVSMIRSSTLSPTGVRAAFEARGEIFSVPTEKGDYRNLTQSPGAHDRSPAWSPDGRSIYFARGLQDTRQMDLWRIAASGGQPERLTYHDAYVGFPTPIDDRHVLYIAKDREGSGPWLWALDTKSHGTRRVAYGTEQYLSIAASADRRRLVASVANPSASLWTVPILDHPAEDGDAKPMVLPTVRALSPRFVGQALFYLSSQGTGDGLWRFEDGKSVEILKGSDEALFEPPAVSADGRQLAVILRRDGKLRLHVLSADGGDLQSLAEPIDIRGAVCWSPDAKWITAGGIDDRGPGLFKIPLDRGASVRLIAGTARDPVWSPSGDLIVYTGQNISVDAPLLAIRPDGTNVELPAIRLRVEGKRYRFLPNGLALVYAQGPFPAQDFWLLDLATKKSRQLSRLHNSGATQSFDVTADGKQIVFDRVRQNSDIVLIDLAQ
jgi:Tol biopolymer transport system component